MPTERPRFLVVDDDPVIRVLVATILDELGPVEVAEDGAAALWHLMQHRVDVVVLDIMMPRLSGMQALAAIRADEWLHDLPVLLLSARDQQVDRIEGYRAGADAYVTKPFDSELLLVVAQGLLEDRHAVRHDPRGTFADLPGDVAPMTRHELHRLAGAQHLDELAGR